MYTFTKSYKYVDQKKKGKRSPINTTSQHNFTLTKIERETETLKIHSENGLASFHARNTGQFSFTL